MNVFSFRLRNASMPAKVLICGFLISLGLAYVYAVANIALVVGLTPKDVAVHYYGADKVISEKPAPVGEQSLDLEEVAELAKPAIGPRPSFKNLVQEGHFHLFGMTTFFFILTFLALFTNLSDNSKAWAVGLPFFAVIVDNISFMATRFLGPNFAYLTALSGALMGVVFTFLWITVGIETLSKKVSS